MSLTLLTGSNGFLGKHIFNKNFEKQDVHTLNRFNSNYNYDLSHEKPYFSKDFNLVIHAAGKAHFIPKSIEDELAFWYVNVIGTRNLLNALEAQPPKYFVFVSSVAVYGKASGHLLDEQNSLSAQDPYGKSKIEAEKIVKKWCIEKNIIYTILRLPLVVGENPPGNLRAMIYAIKKGYYFNMSGGTARKSMVLASDVAKFILKAAEVGGTYNLTDGYHPNFNELSHCIAKQINRNYVPNMPIFFAKILAFVGDIVGEKFPINSNKFNKITSTLTFDDSKAREAFGWNPTPVLKGFKIHE
jgi:nucleoside-diphosphate-sugar epimerase